jgi:hypothetical protein
MAIFSNAIDVARFLLSLPCIHARAADTRSVRDAHSHLHQLVHTISTYKCEHLFYTHASHASERGVGECVRDSKLTQARVYDKHYCNVFGAR